MAYYFNFVWLELAIVILTMVLAVISYFKWKFSYWERRNVPFLQPKIPFGNVENPLVRKYTLGVLVKQLYDEFKSRGAKHAGIYMFTRHIYLPIDPELVRNIMAKDFHYFTDRGLYSNEKDDPLSAHLIVLEGQKWKNMRTKLTPTFTSGKMKMMFQTFLVCGEQLQDAITEHCKNDHPLDIKDFLCSFTTDIIGSCAFGLDMNSFKNPNTPFRLHGNCVFPRTRLELLKQTLILAFPKLSKSLGLKSLPTEAADFFMKLVKDTVEYREKNNIRRNDFMQILIDLRNSTDEKDGFTMEQIAAQSFVFFTAGFDTSSTTMNFCLYELARHQQIQQKVRKEINEVIAKHGSLTYDAIMDMKYLEQVIDETLRKFPPAPYVPRMCNKDYKVSGTNVTIEKGTTIGISILGLHNDPEYFPEPDKFDPERFNEENKKNIRPFTYMPFGDGPRICIGLRFGLLQTKVGLTMMLKNFNFTINPLTNDPLELDPVNYILTPKNSVWLNAKPV